MRKKGRIFRKFCFVLFLFLCVNLGYARLDITVESDRRWGNAPTSNIKQLCGNVADHFQEVLRDAYKLNGKLTIAYRSTGPIAWYRTAFGGEDDEYKIGLTITGTYWNQMAYQFGHEFCHLLTNHDRISKNNPNIWFHEAICEMASIWVLERMAETWNTNPPYNNWRDYRRFLRSYANDRLAENPEYQGTGSEWLTENEDAMRSKFDREKIRQLSFRFLPIFRENQEAWNTVRQMPASTTKMSEYMKDWYKRVDGEDKQYVEAMAEIMGITVTSPVVASAVIDADVNDDGYVDLSDVMIVRSGMQNSTSYDTDLNNDGVTDEVDLLIVKAKAMEAIAAASPRKRKVKITTWGNLKRR